MIQVGEKLPQVTFSLMNAEGKSNPTTDDLFAGKKVVLYFYPKDNTPGCTAQACDLRDNYALLQEKGYVILGISSDDEKSHQKFRDKFELPFPLLADTEKVIHDQYDTWKEKSMYGRKYMGTVRTTFIIDEEGNIEDIIKKVKTKEHTKQIIG